VSGAKLQKSSFAVSLPLGHGTVCKISAAASVPRKQNAPYTPCLRHYRHEKIEMSGRAQYAVDKKHSRIRIGFYGFEFLVHSIHRINYIISHGD